MRSNISTIRRQLDRQFKRSDVSLGSTPPRGGWVRTLRQALGMRLIDLGERMGVTEGGIRNLERSEKQGTITLERLRGAAEAMDCELVYAIRPKVTLEDTFRCQVSLWAKKVMGRTSATMDMELQSLSVEEIDRQLDELIQESLRHPPRDLWHA